MTCKLARMIVMTVAAVSVVACTRRVQQTGAAPVPAKPAAVPMDSNSSKDAPGGKFSYAPAGIELQWPDGWKQTKMQGFEWTIIPAAGKDGEDPWISLDVPTLPLHPPGLIPIGRVESGYLDDLKKQYGKLDVKDLTAPKLPDAKVRMVRAAWQKDGKTMQQTALLIVHADHVYIVRGRSDSDHEQATRQSFDSVTGSIRWIKRR